MEQSIIKIEKRQRRFVTIDSKLLEDERLSWKARGIIAYLLTRPPSWKVRVKDLQNRSSKDGREAVQSGLKELILHGYARLVPVFDESGKLSGREYRIYEDPEELKRIQEDEERKSRPSEILRQTGNPTVVKSDGRESRPNNKNEDLLIKEFIKKIKAKNESFFDVVSALPGQPTDQKFSSWLEEYGEGYLEEQINKFDSWLATSTKGKRSAKKLKSFQLSFGNWIKKEYLDPSVAVLVDLFCFAFERRNGVPYIFNRFDQSPDVKSIIAIRDQFKTEGLDPNTAFEMFLEYLPEFYWKHKPKTIWTNFSTIRAEARAEYNGTAKKKRQSYSTASKDLSWMKD